MRIPESELIINSDGSVFHLHVRPEELADNVILVGDPGRVDMVSYYLDDIEFRHASREFVSVTGRRNGKRITVISHGIGPDNIDIVMTELDALANLNFETREVNKVHRSLNIIRIGTSGALHADIPLGSFILSQVSIGFDGVLNWYEGRDSVSMLDVEKDFKKHMGWSEALPSPYFVKASPKIIGLLEDCTVKADMLEKIESFRFGEDCRITNFEMEGAPLAGFAALLGHNAGTVCCAIANRYLQNSNPDYKPQVQQLIELVVDRMSRL